MTAHHDVAISALHFFSRKLRGSEVIQMLLDTAEEPLIWETNAVTDPETGMTSVVFQFRGRAPVALRFSLEDWTELQERMRLSLAYAGFAA